MELPSLIESLAKMVSYFGSSACHVSALDDIGVVLVVFQRGK